MATLTDAVPGRAVPGAASPGRLAPAAAVTVTAGPAGGAGAAPRPATGAGVTHGSAPAGAGVAPQPAVATATAVTAGPAGGSGSAPGPARGIAVTTAGPAGAGTAPPPAVAAIPAATVSAGQAAGAGTAPAPALRITVTPASAPAGAGTAPPPTVAAVPVTTVSAGQASSAGSAPGPALAVTVAPAPSPAGAGTAPAPSVSTATAGTGLAGQASSAGQAPAPAGHPASTPPGGAPAGTGTAPPPSAAAATAAPAGQATGAGQAPAPSVATAATVAAGAPASTGTAPAPAGAAAIAATTGPAGSAGQAPAPAPATAVTQAPPAPAGAGAAPPPTASTSTAATAAASPASGDGQAPPPAGTAASPETPPAAPGTGTAPRPALGVTAAVHAGLAAGTGDAAQAAAYTGLARAGLAAGTGTAPGPDVWAFSEVAGFVADSLVIARVIELLGGGVPSTVPQCAGAVFRLGRGYDLGSPQPVVDLLMTLMGDGSRPLSWRADNRTLTLPVTILVPTTGNLVADRLTLSAARELLLEAISADEFTIVWAPDGQNGGLNLVWDCFRAHAAQVNHDVLRARQLVSEMVITFDALPYGRSDTLTSLVFDSPVAGQTAPVTPLTVDDYSTVSTSTQATWFSQSPVTALFTNSAMWSHLLTDSNSPLTYTRTLAGAIDLTNYGKLTFYLGLGADPGEYRLWTRDTPVTVAVTLTDNLSRTLAFSTRVAANASADAAWPKWNQVTLTIPQGRTFNYNNVTKYQIIAWNQVHTWLSRLELSATAYLSGLRAVPSTSPKRPASIRGGTYVLYDVLGSAPAPLAVHCQLGYVEQQATTKTITLPGTPGTTNQYTAPPENPNWLSGDSTNFDTGTTGQWTGSDGAATNATLTASGTQAHSGAFSLRMQAASAATMTAASTTTANVPVQGVPCSAGDRIAVRAWVRAGTTGRSVTVGAQFFTAASAPISVVSLSPVTDSSGAWTQINGRVTAPATAAFARLVVTVASPASSELHYVDDAYLAYAVQGTVVCNAAGGGGGSTTDRQNAGGGAGAGEIAWEVNLDLTPGANHAYQVGTRGIPRTPVNNVAGSGDGTDGGDTTFAGSTVTVTAHGGKKGGGAVQSYIGGAGGLGGTGSSNTHHFNGGAGSAGDYTQWEGGGGGGGAGDGGAGAAAGSGGQHNPGAGGAAGGAPASPAGPATRATAGRPPGPGSAATRPRPAASCPAAAAPAPRPTRPSTWAQPAATARSP